MKENEIPDLNIFMICDKLNKNACSYLSNDYSFRLCRPDEIDIWAKFHFDDEEAKKQNYEYMITYFNNNYVGKQESFFDKCLFVVDKNNQPVATCFSWKAYNFITTIHWFKTLKQCEGKGIGRALLTRVMEDLKDKDYPVLLHTQPSSFRAIKLYSDFGFKIVTDEKVGIRTNNYKEALPILKQFMFETDYNNLKFCNLNETYKKILNKTNTNEF